MLNKDQYLDLYENLKIPRYIEERMLLLLRQGKLSKWFSGIGQEAISVGSTLALNKRDVILPMHRNLGVFTSRKVDYKKLFCQLFGREGGYTKGRDRTFHFGDLDNNIVGMISHLAAMLPVADGIALSFKLKKQNRIALSFIGDGATSEGDFHEALNLAAVWKLPVIFLIENNGYGLSTPTHEQYKCENLVDKAIGYGIEGKAIDGNDVVEVYETIKECSEKIKKLSRPFLIEARTFRLRGHEEASGTKYVPKEIIEQWKKKDPIDIFEKKIIEKGIITKVEIKKIEEKISKQILPSIEFALNQKKTNSTVDVELSDVYSKVKSYKQINFDINKSKNKG